MNGVVNADVAGTETAQQSGVVRIYNRVHLQPGNVPSPDGNSRMAADGGQRGSIDNAFAVPFGGQKGVLHDKKFPVQRYGRRTFIRERRSRRWAVWSLGKLTA